MVAIENTRQFKGLYHELGGVIDPMQGLGPEDLNTRQLSSASPVAGQMPLGSFSAGNIKVDLGERTVTLGGRARLHIVQGAIRGQR